MKYRLLVDLEVLDFLSGMTIATRRRMRAQFQRILEAPAECTDYRENDEVGRILCVNIFGGYAIKFWDDLADRHIKILSIVPAD